MNTYTTPELEIIAFDAEDIIATSEVSNIPDVDQVVSLGVDIF